MKIAPDIRCPAATGESSVPAVETMAARGDDDTAAGESHRRLALTRAHRGEKFEGASARRGNKR